MRKKLTAILIALTITISLLPMPAMAAVSDDEKAVINAAVSKLITDYAKQVYRPEADDKAFSLFLKHGFYGNHKDMVLDESSPVVSALFNSCLLQDALISGIASSVTIMQNMKVDTLCTAGGPNWHSFDYSCNYRAYLGEEIDPEKFIGYPAFIYSGNKNENDDVMELLGGGVNARFVVREVERNNSKATYTIDLHIYDRFDFTTDYDKIKEKGYDTSKDQDLVNLGYLLTFVGLDEFDWEFRKTFRLEVPVRCDHGSYNYHWTYDGATISISSEEGSGFKSNPAEKKVHEYKSSNGKTGTSIYHELQDSVVLRHDRPWVLELDETGLQNMQFSPKETNTNAVRPTIYAQGQEGLYLYFYEYEVFEEESRGWYEYHYLGVKIKERFEYNAKHRYTYTLENKVNADGSNMIYLSLYDHDLEETVIGPEAMDDLWTGTTESKERIFVTTESDMASGCDIVINYLGNKSTGIQSKSATMDLRVWENGKNAEPDAGTYTAPTCTEQGGYLHHCHKCGDDYLTDAEAELGHTFGDYTDDNNTTCTTDGTKTRSCTVCGYTDTVTIEGSAFGHNYSDYADDGNATCTVDGTETRTCVTCGEKETRTMEGSAQGHQFGAYQFDHNSTCTADGTLTAVCSVCGEKDIINADGSATGHNHKSTVTEPTCTEQGYTTYTCHCGDIYVDDYVDPIPHAEVVIPAIPSTCVEKGKTEGKQCELCGEITVPQTPTAYGNHTWDEGTVIKQPTANEPGTLMYTCVNCSKTTHMSITEMPSTGFDDVPADAYYAAAVAWAKENGITSGLSANLFGSDMSCTRGQVVTFLWAAAGRPEPKSADNPFTDVSENDYFCKPVLWAVENGITGGIGDGLFGPHETCTRGQIVTFLWASQGKPASGSSTFTDVADTDWYAKSVVWAAENQVTGGIGNNMFGPNNTCTRAQVVTFLYKVYG